MTAVLDRAQRVCATRATLPAGPTVYADLEIDSVDAFQGREKEAALLGRSVRTGLPVRFEGPDFAYFDAHDPVASAQLDLAVQVAAELPLIPLKQLLAPRSRGRTRSVPELLELSADPRQQLHQTRLITHLGVRQDSQLHVGDRDQDARRRFFIAMPLKGINHRRELARGRRGRDGIRRRPGPGLRTRRAARPE